MSQRILLLPLFVTTNLPNNQQGQQIISNTDQSQAQANATSTSNAQSGAALSPDEIALDSLAWELLDGATGKSLCSGSRHIGNKPAELAEAISELTNKLDGRQFVPITCGPLSLRQNLHPAAFRAQLELPDCMFQYLDLLNEFWSSRQLKPTVQSSIYPSYEGSSYEIHRCYCCDTTYHEQQNPNPYGLYQSSQVYSSQISGSNSSLNGSPEGQVECRDSESSSLDNSTSPSSSSSSTSASNSRNKIEESQENNNQEEIPSGQSNFAPFLTVLGATNQAEMNLANTGGSQKNLNFSYQLQSNTEAERNEMEQLEEVLKCKLFPLI